MSPLRQLSIMVVALVSCADCHEYRPPTNPAISMGPATARLYWDGSFACTAWKLSEHMLMTAGHCAPEPRVTVDEHDEMTVTPIVITVEGIEGPVHVAAVDHILDLAILDAGIAGQQADFADDDSLAVGDPVYYHGYPTGVELTVSGYYSGRQMFGDDAYGVISAPAAGGASGSAVVDGSGRVVGVLVVGNRRMNQIVGMVTIDRVRTFIRDRRHSLGI